MPPQLDRRVRTASPLAEPTPRQPDDVSGAYSRRCTGCWGSRGRGTWRLCRTCDPAPWWAHLPFIRLLPWVRRRWF